jgi:hypothetical protein
MSKQNPKPSDLSDGLPQQKPAHEPLDPATLGDGHTDARVSARRVGGGRRGGNQGTPPSNTVPPNCNLGFFKPLRWGVDSLYLSYPGKLKNHLESYLHRLKEKAQSPDPSIQSEAQFRSEGHIFEVKDKGAPLFPYILEDNAYRIQLSRSAGKVPLAYVKVSSEYLSHVPPKNAEKALNPIIGYLREEEGEADARVSRIDLFVDFVSSVDMESWDRHAWVTRARSIHAYSVDNQFSGWSVGLGGVISARLYDKTLEIEKSRKTYLFDLWYRAGWDGNSKVWRLEFELKRDVLIEHGLVSLDAVLSHLNGLWSYATTEWLRLTLPQIDDKTRSRWPTHPLWDYLSAIDWETPGGPLTNRFSNERIPSKESIYHRYLSVLTSFMAMAGMEDIEAAAYDLYGFACDHFQKISEIIGVPFEDFVLDKVAAKSRLYNTMMNADQENGLDEAVRDAAEAYRSESDGE